MANVLIIGAGGLGQVVAHKCVQNHIAFDSICLASRSIDKCRRIRKESGSALQTDAVDADRAGEVERLIRKHKADIVINVALPYQNLPIMEACLAAEAHYIDTAVPEAPAESWFEPDDRYWYGKQWQYHERFRQRGITAILGIGSDPGMVNVFCSYADTELFDEILSIDILDVNAGENGYPFTTNFNPEINLREVQNPVHYWKNGQWQREESFSVRMDFDFPEIGQSTVYLMDHDELHSLYKNFPEAHHIKFWMGFTARYREYFHRLKALGLLSVEPIEVEMEDGCTRQVVPLKVLKALLPDPASLGSRYVGKSCIGCLIQGKKHGAEKKVFIYNICSHQAAYQETGTQAISYVAGVPPVVAALLLINGKWHQPGVHNVEQLDPMPFLDLLPQLGMDWVIREEC